MAWVSNGVSVGGTRAPSSAECGAERVGGAQVVENEDDEGRRLASSSTRESTLCGGGALWPVQLGLRVDPDCARLHAHHMERGLL